MAQSKQDMGSGNVRSLMLQLMIPAVVAQVVNLLYNIVDRIYIGHIVYLLKKAAKDHRHRKNSQRFKGWICDQIFIFRHDYIPSKNRLSQILSQVKKFVQHSNGIFAICNSPLLH